MKSASHLHSKLTDRASWSLIPFWSQHWTNDKNKAHDNNYDLLVKILSAMVWDVLYLLRLCSNAMICVKKVWRDKSNRLVYKYDWKHSVSQHKSTFILSVLTLQFYSDMTFTIFFTSQVIFSIKSLVIHQWFSQPRTHCFIQSYCNKDLSHAS